MPDAVAVRTVLNSPERLIVNMTNISDGTGESLALKVDKSTLLSVNGAEPVALDIERVEWACSGMQARLFWDHATDDVAMLLDGVGSITFVGDSSTTGGLLMDPKTADSTGDILLTTFGHTAGDTYNISLWLRKRP